MSKTFRYAICNNKITQILHGSKAVWYDDEGNRRVEEVRYIVADNWEQAKEFIKQGASEVAVAENATTTQAKPKPLNMAECRSALEAIADSARTGSISTLPSAKLILRTCELALAAPARNCERYATLESALAAWREQPPSVGPFDNWLFDYTKESEAAK